MGKPIDMSAGLSHPEAVARYSADTLRAAVGAPRTGRPKRMRPLKALHHMRRLLADKESTDEVFHILRHLAGDSFERSFRRWLAHPGAEARIAQARVLPDLLDDHNRWLALPPGTFGREYAEFMRREGLSARGLVEDSLKVPANRAWRAGLDPLRHWFADRSRDTHDLYHVLTGLGRDALGETCVLQFTYPQHGKPFGLLFIGYLGAREASKAMPRGAPWRAALAECRRIGREAELVDAQDLIALFPLPLSEARARLRIRPAQAYHRCHRMCREAGIDPYTLVAA